MQDKSSPPKLKAEPRMLFIVRGQFDRLLLHLTPHSHRAPVKLFRHASECSCRKTKCISTAKHGPAMSNPSCYCLRPPTIPRYRNEHSNMLLAYSLNTRYNQRGHMGADLGLSQRGKQRTLDISRAVTVFLCSWLAACLNMPCRWLVQEISSGVNSTYFAYATLSLRSHSCWRFVITCL
jgi:hypothetical protein